MNKLKQQFIDSANELKSVRNLVTISCLIAVSIVIGSFTIAIGNYIKIGFSSVVNEFTCMLFGPVGGIIFGALSDILNYIIKPTGAFFPGFTLNAMISGMLYGIFLYHKKITLKRVLLAKLVVVLVVNLGLATYWLSVMYGNSFVALFPARFIKNMIMLPINSVILYTVIKAFKQTPIYANLY